MGRVLVGSFNGVYLLKFEGDVRLTIGPATNRYIDGILSSNGFRSVLIDLSETERIDSTSLGLLARLSIRTKQQYSFVPTLVCGSSDLLRVLHTMGFDEIFHIVDEAPMRIDDLGELPSVDVPKDDLRRLVIDAHKTLMSMNTHNFDSFQELVQDLEDEASSSAPGPWLGASPG